MTHTSNFAQPHLASTANTSHNPATGQERETLAISSHQRTQLLHKLSLHIIHAQVLLNTLKDRDKNLDTDQLEAFSSTMSDFLNVSLNRF